MRNRVGTREDQGSQRLEWGVVGLRLPVLPPANRNVSDSQVLRQLPLRYPKLLAETPDPIWLVDPGVSQGRPPGGDLADYNTGD